MKYIFNFKVTLSTKSINNILRLATLAAACLALPTHALAQSSCPADLNGDGEVDSSDLGFFLLVYGPCPTQSSCPADLNGDGEVDSSDLGSFLLAYGPCPEPTISAVSPNTGTSYGGTTITITGTNLIGTSRVQVGWSNNATNIVVVNDTTVTAVTPATGTYGVKNVTVTTTVGTVTLVGAFTYFDSSWYTILDQAPNATVVPDATVRANIVATGFPWRVLDKGTGIEMLLVPPDTFTMGCSPYDAGIYANDCDLDEDPTHEVTLTKAFYLGKTEVTQKQWQDKMGNNPSGFDNASDSPSRPVDKVSWDDVADFNTATGLRFPTEAEWEYACRGGTTTAIHSTPERPNGSNKVEQLDSIAWYGNSFGHTHAVAGKAANAFGMYDMSGNVYEWCNDFYESSYYSNSPPTNPLGPSSGTYRVTRGGSWSNISFACRSSYRGGDAPDYRNNRIGFRAARNP
jgi:formylglycine-generating enzyme required for sulfatase activity